jgi:hypothetical protein
MKKRLPSIDLIHDVFRAAGFRSVADGTVVQEIAPNYSVFADRVAVGADSILTSLEPADFQAGLNALRLHAARAPARPVTETIDFFVFA